MPTADMIRDLLHADRGTAISIHGISDLVADYAQSTPGDRLLIFLSQKCGDDRGIEFRKNHPCSALLFLRGRTHQNGDVFVNVSYIYTKQGTNERLHPFGNNFWMVEHMADKLKRSHNIPVLQYIYEQIMAIP